MIPRLSFIFALLSLFSVVGSLPTGSTGHAHGHEHGLLANGRPCSTSSICQSQNCNWGTCAVKKPDGQRCYKDNGCLSGYCRRGVCGCKKEAGRVCYKDSGCLSNKCDHHKCRGPSSGHTSPSLVTSSTSTRTTSATTSTGTATSKTTSTSTSTTTSVTISTARTSTSTTTPTTMSTSSTPTSTATSTTMSTSSTPTSTTTPTSTSKTTTTTPAPEQTAGPYNPGRLYAQAQQVAGAGDTFSGFLYVKPSGHLYFSTQISQSWQVTSEGYLQAPVGGILMTDGNEVIVGEPSAAALRRRLIYQPEPDPTGTKHAYYCTVGADSQNDAGVPASPIECTADLGSEKTSSLFICGNNNQVVADVETCTSGPSGIIGLQLLKNEVAVSSS